MAALALTVTRIRVIILNLLRILLFPSTSPKMYSLKEITLYSTGKDYQFTGRVAANYYNLFAGVHGLTVGC